MPSICLYPKRMKSEMDKVGEKKINFALFSVDEYRKCEKFEPIK